MDILILKVNRFGFSPFALGTIQEFLKEETGIAHLWPRTSLYGQNLYLFLLFLSQVFPPFPLQEDERGLPFS
jgi:hypothetical protein